jgi:hypothetical protein
MKICNKCNVEKDDSEFYVSRNECKTCKKERSKLYRQNNLEKVKERRKLYYQNNTEKMKERKKLYRQNNTERVKEYSRLYYQDNLEKVKERRKLYYQNNPEKERERNKIYRQNNRKKEMIRHARLRAKEKQLPFDLQEEDIMVPQVCPVFGTPLQNGEKIMSSNSPSLDRIIPEKGYVKGNVIIVSEKVNRIKSNATPEEIIAVGEFYKKLLEEAKKNE